MKTCQISVTYSSPTITDSSYITTSFILVFRVSGGIRNTCRSIRNWNLNWIYTCNTPTCLAHTYGYYYKWTLPNNFKKRFLADEGYAEHNWTLLQVCLTGAKCIRTYARQSKSKAFLNIQIFRCRLVWRSLETSENRGNGLQANIQSNWIHNW